MCGRKNRTLEAGENLTRVVAVRLSPAARSPTVGEEEVADGHDTKRSRHALPQEDLDVVLGLSSTKQREGANHKQRQHQRYTAERRAEKQHPRALCASPVLEPGSEQ